MNRIKKVLKRKLLNFIISRFSRNEILNNLLNKKEYESLKFVENGYLKEIGWWNSWESKEPQNLKKKPIPWVTYSFIYFITERLTKEMKVFEFGSGNSTFFFSDKVSLVDSVEHDQEWYIKINKILPKNASLYFEKLEYGGIYSKMALKTESNYDLIIVDGRDRVNSLINSLDALSDKGVMVLDDSERENYQKGIKFLLDKGFKRIDFWGISPGFIDYNKCTTIFYCDNNILNI